MSRLTTNIDAITCPCCGRAVKLMKSGHIRRHGYQGGRGSGPTCPGYGWEPELALEGAIAEAARRVEELLAEASESESHIAKHREREAAAWQRELDRLSARRK